MTSVNGKRFKHLLYRGATPKLLRASCSKELSIIEGAGGTFATLLMEAIR